MPRHRYNFGRNVRFNPAATATPKNEADLLDVLRRYEGMRIRAIGSGHAWSEAAATEGLAVDMRHFDHVELVGRGIGGEATRSPRTPGPPGTRVRVGAGCTVRRLLRELRAQGGLTLPSLGLIQAQTVAGATATGTHGSGANSMSHYVQGARIAHFDPTTGEPTIRVVNSGAELQAVRCSLGALGIVTELTLWARPQYQVHEVFRVYTEVSQLLDAEERYPLQQFYLVPWDWRYYAQQRVEDPGRGSATAWLYRVYWMLVLDLGLHLVILMLARGLRTDRGVRAFFGRLAGAFVARAWPVVDRSDRQLTMHHDWFRHIEIELFVQAPDVVAALEFTRDVLTLLSGGDAAPPLVQSLERIGMLEAARSLRGTYTHHYPICVRRVLPDETLISMTAGDTKPRYAISFISYAAPSHRASFMRTAEFLADAMGRLFEARPHWGKVCPIGVDDARRLYPRLAEFNAVRRAIDPEGRFGNAWTDARLGAD